MKVYLLRAAPEDRPDDSVPSFVSQPSKAVMTTLSATSEKIERTTDYALACQLVGGTKGSILETWSDCTLFLGTKKTFIVLLKKMVSGDFFVTRQLVIAHDLSFMVTHRKTRQSYSVYLSAKLPHQTTPRSKSYPPKDSSL